MAIRNKPIDFLERLKDAIAAAFQATIKHRPAEIFLLQVLMGLLWWLVLSLFYHSLIFSHWPIHGRILLNMGWVYLFFLLFFGLIFPAITVRKMLDYLFFPVEFLIHVLVWLWQCFLELVNEIKTKVINWLWNVLGPWVIGGLAAAFAAIWAALVAGGAGVLQALAEAATIIGAAGAALVLFFLLLKNLFMEWLRGMLCRLRDLLIWLKGIPSFLLDTLEAFILDRMKLLSDDERIQALIFQVTLAFLGYSVFLYITEIYNPNEWPWILQWTWFALVMLPQIIMAVFIWMPNSEYGLQRLLKTTFYPVRLLLRPYERLLDWLAGLVPCDKADN